MQTYKIEVRAHFADPEKNKALEEACRDAARQVLATAIMLGVNDRSKPEAKFITEDFIEGITVHDINVGGN